MERNHRDRAIKETFEGLVRKNVAVVSRIERAVHAGRTRADVVADAIAGFCGSPSFIYVHCAWFGAWLVWNGTRLAPQRLRFDSPPFSILTLLVAMEAIFLSTFILISQNRLQRAAHQRNHLDLQINMLAEQESTEMLAMMRQLMSHLGMPQSSAANQALQESTDHEQVAEYLQGVDNLDPAAEQPPLES